LGGERWWLKYQASSHIEPGHFQRKYLRADGALGELEIGRLAQVIVYHPPP